MKLLVALVASFVAWVVAAAIGVAIYTAVRG